MKNYKLLIIFLLFTTCQNTEKKPEPGYRDFFSKLPGKWQQENQNIVEVWESDGKLYKATVYRVLGKNSFVTERIRIKEIEGEIYFEAAVKGQNQEKPVLFKLTESSADKVVFENKMHDFPQMITYQFTSPDNLTATIEGKLNGKKQKVDFKYTRKNTEPKVQD
jgi:hypothetical protein